MTKGTLQLNALTDPGLLRKINEDRYLAESVGPHTHLLVVCDGMGGHRAGHRASELALETIREYVKSSLTEGNTNENELLGEALVLANDRIFGEAQIHPELATMGTTAVVALVRGGRAFIAHVGDSRAYLFRDGALEQLTLDHSTVQRLLDQGKIRQDQAMHHAESHKLTKALGIRRSVEPEILAEPLWLGKEDSLLLCTDGLTDVVEKSRIRQSLFLAPREALQELLDIVRSRGAPDNVTMALYSHSSPAPDAAPTQRVPMRKQGNEKSLNKARILSVVAALILVALLAWLLWTSSSS